MNKYSKFYKGILVAGLLAFAAGCKKLDVVPTDRYTDAVVWQNPANIEQYVAGMYAEFHKYAFGAMPGLGYDNSSDGLTDIFKYTSNSEGNGTANRLAFDPNRVNASSPNINVWAASYTRIRRINEFLLGLEQYGKVDNETKLRYQAEARFVRGYAYFWLAKVNGSVVLLNEARQAVMRWNFENAWINSISGPALNALQYRLLDQYLGVAPTDFQQGEAYRTLQEQLELTSGQRGVIVGATIGLLIMFIAPISQASFNPARDLGPRIMLLLVGFGSVAFPRPNHGLSLIATTIDAQNTAGTAIRPRCTKWSPGRS